MTAERLVSLLTPNTIEHLRKRSAGRDRHPAYEIYGLARGCRTDEAFRAALRKGMETRDRDALEAVLGDLPVHPAADAMMRVIGVDPVDLVAVTAMGGTGIDIPLPGGSEIGTYADLLDRRFITSLHLSSDAIWEQGLAGTRGHSIEIFRPFPEMIKAALPGRPLSDLMTHPVTDPLGMTITEVEDYERNASLIVHLEYAPSTGQQED